MGPRVPLTPWMTSWAREGLRRFFFGLRREGLRRAVRRISEVRSIGMGGAALVRRTRIRSIGRLLSA